MIGLARTALVELSSPSGDCDSLDGGTGERFGGGRALPLRKFILLEEMLDNFKNEFTWVWHKESAKVRVW